MERRSNARISADATVDTVLRALEEFRVDERLEQRLADERVEPPEPLRLWLGQTEPWHFKELGLHDVQVVHSVCVRMPHGVPPF